MDTNVKQPDQLKAFVETLGLEYKAEFVPWSKSRFAKPKPKLNDYSLNWKVSFSKNGRILRTDYMQGIGHIPGFKHSSGYTMDEADRITRACEQGKIGHPWVKPIPAPEPHDVLYSLGMDSSVLDHAGFEEWARDYGYDVDSRSAEKTYRECLRLALELRALIGEDGLAKLREASQDY